MGKRRLKEQQKSVDILDTKRGWYLNKTTTEFRNIPVERKPKQERKQSNNNNSNSRTQNRQRQNRCKKVKTEAEAEFLVKKNQITKGLQNKMQQMIRTKNTLLQRNQEINTATRKTSINLGNSTVLPNNNKKKKKKSEFDAIVIEPIRNEETEERRQSQTVIVTDNQEADRG